MKGVCRGQDASPPWWP